MAKSPSGWVSPDDETNDPIKATFHHVVGTIYRIPNELIIIRNGDMSMLYFSDDEEAKAYFEYLKGNWTQSDG